MAPLPVIAIVAAGNNFIMERCIPRLLEISDLFVLKTIFSTSEEAARRMVDIAKEKFPEVECKWESRGVLKTIAKDAAIDAVLVAYGPRRQVLHSLRMLRNGKHVLQMEPLGTCIGEVEKALSFYDRILKCYVYKPIWGVIECFRFEPAFEQGAEFATRIGDLINFKFIIEIPTRSSNPFFKMSWSGNYILELAGQCAAVLRMLTRSVATSVYVMTNRVDTKFRSPDCMSAVIRLGNGCSGVISAAASVQESCESWELVGLKGKLLIKLEKREGTYGYSVTLDVADGQNESHFHPRSCMIDGVKAFFRDVSRAMDNIINLTLQRPSAPFQAEPRLSVVEAARDTALTQALLNSARKADAVQVSNVSLNPQVSFLFG